MPHQINLYRPPADAASPTAPWPLGRGLAVATLVAVVAGVALLGWSRHDSARAQAAWAKATTERDMLRRDLARLGAASDTRALDDEIAQARQTLQRLHARHQLDAAADAAPTPWLGWLAEHTPPAAWLRQVRVGGGRVEIHGSTLHPDALSPWLRQLASQAPRGPWRIERLRLRQDPSAIEGRRFDFEIVAVADAAADAAAEFATVATANATATVDRATAAFALPDTATVAAAAPAARERRP
jgi:Tfp pilus assembly protein PilN